MHLEPWFFSSRFKAMSILWLFKNPKFRGPNGTTDELSFMSGVTEEEETMRK